MAGVKLKSVGQNPAAADSVGIGVNRVRYFGVCLGAVLAGVAGASLSIGQLGLFQDNLTSGQGFIAVALVYFGGWRPIGVLAGRAPVQRRQQLPALDAGAGRQGAARAWRSCCPTCSPSSRSRVTANRARQPAALNKSFERGEG